MTTEMSTMRGADLSAALLEALCRARRRLNDTDEGGDVVQELIDLLAREHDSVPTRLTRKQAVPFLNAHGFPVSFSSFNKICMPKYGRSPPVSAWWGKRPLYAPDELLAWAHAQLRNAPPVTCRRA